MLRRAFAPLLAATLALAGCGQSALLANGRDGGMLDALRSKGPRGNDVEWTIFVYMAADNSLSDDALHNLNQMEAGLDTDRVKIVCLVDQAKQGDSRIVEIAHDPNGMNDQLVSPVVDDHGAVIPPSHEVDTGSPETLERFLTWGAKNYKSHRAMAIIWNHGGSAFEDPAHLKSFAWDDSSNSHLNLIDFYRAVARIDDHEKFEIVGFDTCLLGHAETVFQLGMMTQFVVGSEKTEPGDGWDYFTLAKSLSADPMLTPRALADVAVRSYHDYFAKTEEETTLSAIDAKKMRTRVVPVFNQLAGALQRDIANPAAFDGMRAAFDQAYKISAPNEDEVDAVDLALVTDLLAKTPALAPDTRALAAKANEEVHAAVSSNATTRTPAGAYNGLKIYFDAQTYNDAYSSEYGTAAWAKFLQAYSAKRGTLPAIAGHQ